MLVMQSSLAEYISPLYVTKGCFNRRMLQTTTCDVKMHRDAM